MTKKQLKNTLLGATAMLSSIFLIAGCGGPDNPQAIALDKIDIKDIANDLSNDKLPSDKDLEEISKKLGTLPTEAIYNEEYNLKDTIDAYLQLKHVQDERKKSGAKEVPTDKNIVTVDTYLTNALKGSENSYVGQAYQYVYGTPVPVDEKTIVIDIAGKRQVRDGVGKFRAYQDGVIELEDSKGFKYTAIKYVEVSDYDYQYTASQKELNKLKDVLHTEATTLKETLSKDNLDKYIENVTNTPVPRVTRP